MAHTRGTVAADWTDDVDDVHDDDLDALSTAILALQYSPNPVTAATVAVADAPSVSTTITKLGSLILPAGKLKVGSTFRITAVALQSVSTATAVFSALLGTNNSVADTVATSVSQSVTSGQSAMVIGLVTIRTLGSGGTAIAEIMATVNGSATVSTTSAAITVNTTVDNYLSFAVTSPAGVSTSKILLIEQVA